MQRQCLQRLARQFGISLTAAFCAIVSATSLAGTWGDGKWGQMYWGTNEEGVPTIPPTIDEISVDGNELTVTILEYPEGTGVDGWLRPSSYAVTCGNEPTVTSPTPIIVIPDLDPDTEYQCTVQAINAEGGSPLRLQLATTGAALSGGLSIPVLRIAACRGDNPPANC